MATTRNCSLITKQEGKERKQIKPHPPVIFLACVRGSKDQRSSWAAKLITSLPATCNLFLFFFFKYISQLGGPDWTTFIQWWYHRIFQDFYMLLFFKSSRFALSTALLLEVAGPFSSSSYSVIKLVTTNGRLNAFSE